MSGWHIRDNLLLRFCCWLLFSLSLIFLIDFFLCLFLFVCLFFVLLQVCEYGGAFLVFVFLFCCKFVKMVIHSLSLVLIPSLCFWFLVFVFDSRHCPRKVHSEVWVRFTCSHGRRKGRKRPCVLKWHLKSGFSSVLALWWTPLFRSTIEKLKSLKLTQSWKSSGLWWDFLLLLFTWTCIEMWRDRCQRKVSRKGVKERCQRKCSWKKVGS